jgi:hypothetical protein
MEMRVITKEKDWLELFPSSEEFEPAVFDRWYTIFIMIIDEWKKNEEDNCLDQNILVYGVK